jgi:hypothetical protein
VNARPEVSPSTVYLKYPYTFSPSAKYVPPVSVISAVGRRVFFPLCPILMPLLIAILAAPFGVSNVWKIGDLISRITRDSELDVAPLASLVG